MAAFPETEPRKNIIENPEEASPLNIERREVATPIPTHFKAQVHDEGGNPLITTPQTQAVTITIPAGSEEELKLETKGDIEETKTWSSAFWWRAILKAWHFGKDVIFKGGN